VTANIGGACVEGVRRVERLGKMENVTVVVNTALMGRGNTMENLPWLVEIDLLRESGMKV